jgi:hypothetical protein
LLRRLVMTAVDAEAGGTPGPVRRRSEQHGGLRSG